MKKPCKISASTMARTAALALALTNQLLSCTGHSVLPIESEQLEQLVSTGITVAAALVILAKIGWNRYAAKQPRFQ